MTLYLLMSLLGAYWLLGPGHGTVCMNNLPRLPVVHPGLLVSTGFFRVSPPQTFLPFPLPLAACRLRCSLWTAGRAWLNSYKTRLERLELSSYIGQQWYHPLCPHAPSVPPSHQLELYTALYTQTQSALRKTLLIRRGALVLLISNQTKIDIRVCYEFFVSTFRPMTEEKQPACGKTRTARKILWQGAGLRNRTLVSTAQLGMNSQIFCWILS